MTESSVQELHAIDLEAGQAMAAAKLWGEL